MDASPLNVKTRSYVDPHYTFGLLIQRLLASDLLRQDGNFRHVEEVHAERADAANSINSMFEMLQVVFTYLGQRFAIAQLLANGVEPCS